MSQLGAGNELRPRTAAGLHKILAVVGTLRHRIDPSHDRQARSFVQRHMVPLPRLHGPGSRRVLIQRHVLTEARPLEDVKHLGCQTKEHQLKLRGRPWTRISRTRHTRSARQPRAGIAKRAPGCTSLLMDPALRASSYRVRPWRALGSAALAKRLPPALAALAELAYDVRWLWVPECRALFEAIDAELFQEFEENAVDLLLDAPPELLERIAADADFLGRLEQVKSARNADLARPCAPASPASRQHPIAFFCSEFAVHGSLPVYAGGLGVLAGDYLKEASDRALPVVGVGLLYRFGYFHQRLDATGWQHECWRGARRTHLPIEPVFASDGTFLEVTIPLATRQVLARVWRATVGRVPLFLLDTDLPQNSAIDRWITAQLYVGDRQIRLAQYLVLGVGGVRALRALGVVPSVVHLNEGHAALSALELAREHVARGSTFEQAVRLAQEQLVFTTHTPVAAGNETYAAKELAPLLEPLANALGVSLQQVFALGSSDSVDAPASFGLTQLALRSARSSNAVSRRHGEIARAMWQPIFPTHAVTPITHVTNGVHLPTWISQPMNQLLTRYLGLGWQERASDPGTWTRVHDIPDEELWAVRCTLRRSLVEYVRARSVEDRLARGDALGYVQAAAHAFDPEVLTVGFARRVATYKRLHLLTQDTLRSLALLRAAQPIQVVLAGKAHPRDQEGKSIIQVVFRMKASEIVGARVAFLEDHDLNMAARLVSGCDLWVNLPRPPMEASGTSGMKAVMNGGLHLSVLDGWWAEAWDGQNGWAIHSESASDPAVQDARDGTQLYDLLEREVVPLFHARDEAGIPHAWIAKIKTSLVTLGPRFGAGRMLNDYVTHQYATRPSSLPSVPI